MSGARPTGGFPHPVERERRAVRTRSGVDGGEALVDLASVVEDALADLVGRPPGDGAVRIGRVATGEDLIAVAGGVEEVDRLSAGDAVAGGAMSIGTLSMAMRSAARPTSCHSPSLKAKWCNLPWGPPRTAIGWIWLLLVNQLAM